MSTLDRYIEAQDPVMPAVRAELQAGQKRTHWMWFVFPQLHGLGASETARFFALRSAAEAQAYVDHPVLGPRLLECTALVAGHAPRPIGSILGAPDDVKFRSCLTLFATIAPGRPDFARTLGLFFTAPDQRTLDLLGNASDRASPGPLA